MTEEKEEGEKKQNSGLDRFIGWAIGGAGLGILISIISSLGEDEGYKRGVQDSSVYRIESVGDLNNDGIDDLMTYDSRMQNEAYICNKNGECIKQKIYLKEELTRMKVETGKKYISLKILIKENLEEYKSKKIEKGNDKYKK